MPIHPVVVSRSRERCVTTTGILRAVGGIAVGLVLVCAAFVGLVRAGVLASPFAPAVGGDIELARTDRVGLRVLFVGNSFTFQNEMPEMVRRLGETGPGDATIFAVEYTAPGWTLKRASRNEGLVALLEQVRWDVVILQERSWLPSSPLERRRKETVPFARNLHERITRAGARTLLFMTWGYEHGDDRLEDGDTFEAMHARLASGYSDLGAELGASIAPVGIAWAEALERRPDLRLWAEDGRHPSRLGSYLAACVFYATLSGRRPTESRFNAGIATADARFLQRVAADVVFARPPALRVR